MQARITRRVEAVGEVMIVHLSGRVDVETAQPFREACQKHFQNKKIVFDFRSLTFVGSSGILPFLETLQDFARANAGALRFSGVGVEFKKVFLSSPLSVIEIHDSHHEASQLLLYPPPPIPHSVPQIESPLGSAGEPSAGMI